MLLQRLVADADCILADMPPQMYNPKPIKWVVELYADGTFDACMPQVGDGRRGDRGKLMIVPDRTRSGTSPPPILLADNATYTLGLPSGDEKAAARHRSYRAIHQAASDALSLEAFGAVLAFLDAWDAGQVTLPEDIAPADLITFKVDGRLLVDLPQVRRWWAENWNGPTEAQDAGTAARGTCLVCGDPDAIIPPFIPSKLKGLPGEHSAGTSLVSVNDKAFESYDLERGETSRVCRDCGETFMNCLNALLADDRRHMVMGPLIYVYWTSVPSAIDVFGLLAQDPDPAVVGELLSSLHDGKARSAETALYNIVALSASAARAAVRECMQVGESDLQRALASWFELQAQVDAWGEPAQPRGIWRLAASAYRDARKEMTADVPRALMRVALLGEKMPLGLLPRVIERCRVDHDPRAQDRPVTQERALLIRALLASKNGWKAGEMSQLEKQSDDSAYQSGRLMALLEDIQRAALGKVGATVVDKYYGSASATPASVFGKLIGDAQNHLARVRKEREGLQAHLQARLEEVLAKIDAFPRTLTLEKQGMFALGYYHERADLRAARSKKAADAGRDDDTEQE